MNQYLVSDAARSDLDEIWFYIAQDNPDAADKFMRALVSRFPMLASMPEMGRPRGDWRPGCEVFPSAATSSSTARWKTVLKSCACCTARGIFRRCLIRPRLATMEPELAQSYNQDDTTDFIRFKALRLKVAAKAQEKK